MVTSVVGPVDSGWLPSHLDCYSLFGDSTVLVEGQHDPYMVRYDPQSGSTTCDCDEFRCHRRCDHLGVLLGGLWGQLSALPGGASLVVDTRTLCTSILAWSTQAATLH